jgi:hypothetical protein
MVGDGIERNGYGWSPHLAIALTLVLAAAGVLLAIYLHHHRLTPPDTTRPCALQVTIRGGEDHQSSPPRRLSTGLLFVPAVFHISRDVLRQLAAIQALDQM